MTDLERAHDSAVQLPPQTFVQPADIAMRNIHKSFGARQVLAGVDLDIAAETMTAVLGPSGCGKTTLLRILAGFEEPDAGTVSVAGRQLTGVGATVPVHHRRIGLMPQEGALFPHLSVAGNVAFGLGRSRDNRRQVQHWLTVVGLDGLGDARPHELSGGQQQRVALARALAARPRVVLLDEPFTALDAGLRVRVREDITAILRAAGTTSVLVTHDQAEALSLADSVALLMDGMISQIAAPADIYDRPATLTAARFVGATVELPGEHRSGVVRTALGAHPPRVPVADGPVVVVLRPEQLHIGRDDDGSTAALVTASRFYGADSSIHVALADGSPVVLRLPGDVRAQVGQTITVRVEGPVLAYPPSPTGGQRVPLGESGG